MIKWFKAGFSFVVFCMVVILLLPKIFPALDPLIRDFFNPFLPSRPFVSEMTLKQENEEFRRQISQKIFDEKEFLRIQDENNSLRSKLNLSKKLPYEVEIMEVVERHPINWNYSFSVQNTNSDYLSSLHGVLIDGYLIGTGKLDGKKSFRVKTFLNQDVELAVNVRGTNWNGLIKGEYQNSNRKLGRLICLVDFLPRDSEIKPGMIIQSAGVGAIPRGLAIARVLRTEKDEVVQRAEVELLADISSARFVSLLVQGGE